MYAILSFFKTLLNKWMQSFYRTANNCVNKETGSGSVSLLRNGACTTTKFAFRGCRLLIENLQLQTQHRIQHQDNAVCFKCRCVDAVKRRLYSATSQSFDLKSLQRIANTLRKKMRHDKCKDNRQMLLLFFSENEPTTKLTEYWLPNLHAEVGSNNLHLLRYIYLFVYF